MEVNVEVQVNENKVKSVTKKLIIAGIILAILLGLVALAVANSDKWMGMISEKTPVPQAGQLAGQGAEAFFTWDKEKGMDGWSSGICSIASDTGCQYQKKVVAPLVWSGLMKQASRSSAKADEYTLIEDTPANTGKKVEHQQIWKINLTQTVGDSTKPREAYAIVSQKDGEATWTFDRLMFDQEIAARLKTKSKTTPTPGASK
jgi:hypothetical protein